jgi:hypothetical protein
VNEGGTAAVTAGTVGEIDGVIARDIVIAIISATVVRALAWVFSLLIVGPIGGTATFGLSGTSLGVNAPPIAEALLSALALTIALVIAVKVRQGGEGRRRLGRVFGWVLVAETVFYLGSLLIALYVWGGWSNLRDQFGLALVVVLVNLPLIWLGLRIVRRAR